MVKKKRSILIILSVVLIVLFSVGVCFLVKHISNDNSRIANEAQEIQDPTQGWETYSDSKEIVSFKHPKNLFVSDCSEVLINSIDEIYILVSPDNKDDCNSIPKSLSSAIWFSETDSYSLSDYNYLDSRQEKAIDINGIEAIQISGVQEVYGDEGEKLSSEPKRTNVITIIPFKGRNLVVNYTRITSVKNSDNGFVVGKDLIHENDLIIKSIKLPD